MIKRRSTDWDCTCGELNFGKRSKCRKCNLDRPALDKPVKTYLQQIVACNQEPKIPPKYIGIGGYTNEVDNALVITPYTNYYDPDHICEISPAIVAEIDQPVIVDGFLYSPKCDNCQHKVQLLKARNVTFKKCQFADHAIKKHPIYLEGYL